MDKKTGVLIGAVAGLATMGAAHATTPPPVNPAQALQASSYAELLAPVSNAVALVKADDAVRAQSPAPGILDADYVAHHHHHHHQTAVVVPGVGGVVVGH